jgi:hypothetical protein
LEGTTEEEECHVDSLFPAGPALADPTIRMTQTTLAALVALVIREDQTDQRMERDHLTDQITFRYGTPKEK